MMTGLHGRCDLRRNCPEIALKYANDIVSGAIPAAKLTIQAAKRQLSDLEKQDTDEFPYLFNPVLVDNVGKEYRPAERICAFAERLKHVKGVWTGKFIVLEPWQVFFLTTLFGWVHRETGLRRFRECYSEIPRKNGKSVLGAIIGLYMFCADGEGGAEVYSGATTEKQAWEVFRPARLMAKQNESLLDHYSVEVHAKDLMTFTDYSRFEPLIGDPGDGASPHCAIIDEFHEHKSPEQYDTMATGMGARTQPLLCVITTSGSNLAGPCHGKRDQVVKILNGVFDNEEIFGLVFTIDKDDDWTDFKNWKKANPNYGVSVFPEYLKSRLKAALQDPAKQNIIRCKHLNQWMNVATAFFDMVALDKCADPSLSIEDFKGESVWPGIDIASKVDLAAKVNVFKKQVLGVWNYYAFCDFYLPNEAVKGEDKSHYAGWANEGWLHLTHGSRLDIDRIEDDLVKDSRFNVVEVPHDPWNAAQFAAHMMDKNIVMVELHQTVKNLSEPTKELESFVRDGIFHYDGNPILKWCLANVVCEYDTNDNVKPKKAKGQEHLKIAGAIALIMALSRAMVPEEPGSKYESEEMLIL